MKMNTRKLTINAMLAAMCAVLGYIAIDLGNIKITFESLPVFVSALLFGPVDGIVVGTIGTLIYQLLRYGVTATTLLWMLPYAVGGLIVGMASKKQGFAMSDRRTAAVIIIAELVITLLNTGIIYIDSKLYGWYYPALIVGSLAVRLAVCIVKGIVFGTFIPMLIKALRKRGISKQESV